MDFQTSEQQVKIHKPRIGLPALEKGFDSFVIQGFLFSKQGFQGLSRPRIITGKDIETPQPSQEGVFRRPSTDATELDQLLDRHIVRQIRPAIPVQMSEGFLFRQPSQRCDLPLTEADPAEGCHILFQERLSGRKREQGSFPLEVGSVTGLGQAAEEKDPKMQADLLACDGIEQGLKEGGEAGRPEPPESIRKGREDRITLRHSGKSGHFPVHSQAPDQLFADPGKLFAVPWFPTDFRLDFGSGIPLNLLQMYDPFPVMTHIDTPVNSVAKEVNPVVGLSPQGPDHKIQPKRGGGLKNKDLGHFQNAIARRDPSRPGEGPFSGFLAKADLIWDASRGNSQADLHLSPIMKSFPIRQKTCGPHLEPILDGLSKLRSVSRMNPVGRLDNPAVRPLDDKEEKGPVPFPDPVDKIGEMPDGPFRDRIGKKGPVSLPIGDTLDLHIDRPAFFVPKEVVDAASLTVGNLGAGVNPSGGEIQNLSGEQIPGQTIGPVRIDPDPDTGQGLGLFCPETISPGIFRVEGKNGEKERSPRGLKTACQPTRVGTMTPSFLLSLRCYNVGEHGKTFFPAPEDGRKKWSFIAHAKHRPFEGRHSCRSGLQEFMVPRKWRKTRFPFLWTAFGPGVSRKRAFRV